MANREMLLRLRNCPEGNPALVTGVTNELFERLNKVKPNCYFLTDVTKIIQNSSKILDK